MGRNYHEALQGGLLWKGGIGMAEGWKILGIIAVMAAVTFMLRAGPFVLFPQGKKPPQYVRYLGQVLPYAMIAMLIVYCLKDVSFVTQPYGLPELLAIAVVSGIHLWKRNTMLSISVGTVVYMLLIQKVF